MISPFLLDSNILIQSYRVDYPFDIAPGFWDYLIELGNGGLIAFPDVIKKEILGYKDDLSTWFSSCENNFPTILASEKVVIESYNIILSAVMNNNVYFPTAKNQFASVADSWLIAVALAYGLTIVTQEVFEPNCKKKVKIPNVCKLHGVKYISRTEFMRATNFRWK